MNESAIRISDVTTLVLGDLVEVRRFGEVLYAGHIEAIAQSMGVAWVRDHVTGARAMLHGTVFDVFMLRRGAGVAQPSAARLAAA
ncbi:hypothetical protein [Zhihengliuella flava]|uniref:Uncharacterized protein n=1 Tax=Zhihengliuella flava TaxID=1285193 RepID=A0A931D8J9_9MICC|nr:hypothetical protein [Zhihengliuella flava]MBG6084369.1 hypothetical protein [Zhihengliuella flava]